MPTISQLPQATSISAADTLPLSQGGTARSASVGALLASTQPTITVQTGSLLGRISLGAGSPEQVSIGPGVSLSAGTLAANGLDHAGFPVTSALATDADLVICNQGMPMLMPASLLRGLFTAGRNVTIAADGTISASATGTIIGTSGAISDLQVVNALTSQDLVAVSHAGSNCAISYASFLGGVTIDQAQPAGSVSDSDTIWAAQGSNVMASQNFGAIWVWIASKLPTYKAPVLEITGSINLDATVHNGRILVCSQPVTLTPLVANMGSGFRCTVINVSAGNVTLGTGFISSSGSLTIAPQQSASIWCVSYSAGTIAFASIAAAAAAAVPGQAVNLTSSLATPTTIAISWQAPSSGASPTSYAIRYKQSGTTSWTDGATVTGATTGTLSGLLPTTSYDITVQAINAAGVGLPSAILTVTTSAATGSTPPPQVTGLSATPTSSSAVQLTWSAQTGASAATSFTVQYRATGSLTWSGSMAAISGPSATVSGLQAATSYDFSVFGVNASGAGIASSVVTATTQSAQPSVTSITWNMLPSGPYTKSAGAIGVNAFIQPATSPIRFGFSQATTTQPTSWVEASHVNNNLWGAYVPTPTTAGSWYVWAEGLDGSAPTVYATSFLVQ
ncbi:MAG: fibronectin type III domain-containing protein [Rhodopila sp.]